MTSALKILKKFWGHNSFRPFQEEIINSVIERKNTLALMPTGGGKSITYQVPAMMMDGICLVISPLIALMKDQVEQLTRNNIKAMAIYSGMTYHEIELSLNNAVYGNFKFLYVSPERLESDIFKEKVKNMKISLVAIDEAHCISQWGYDFRPSYLNITHFLETFPGIPVLAITATATPKVAKDITKKLNFKDYNFFKTPFTRENLVFAVRDVEDKQSLILQSLTKIKGSGIIYVRNRKNTKELALFLIKNKISADYYHAGLKHEAREIKQTEWTSNKTRIICTTSAFGMGIDKPDVRIVIHYDVPDTLEEYVQEAGRAGRDGKKAYALLLCNNADHVKLKQRLPVKFPEINEIKRIYNALCNYLQIPFGSGKGITFDFNLSSFCSQYKLNILIAYNSLKIIEKEGYIDLTDDLNNPSRVFFTVNRDDLYKFQIANQNFDSFIKLLLRSYTGLFNNYVAIDETSLARKSKLKQDDIYQYLIKLANQKIIKYIPQKKTPLVIFHEERLDNKNLKFSTENYKERKQQYEDRLQSIINYVKDNNTCRNTLILDYFGETTEMDCGKCDNCRKEIVEGISNYEYTKIKNHILKYLNEKKLKTEELQNLLNFNNEKFLKALRILLDYEIISYDDNYNLILK